MNVEVDAALDMPKRLASMRKFAGWSSGAYLIGAHEVADMARAGRAVIYLNDLDEMCLGTGMWG